VAHYKKKSPRRLRKARRFEHGWTCQGRLRYQRHFHQIEKAEAELLIPGSSNGRTADFESENAGSMPAPGVEGER
jgi:hypothetical protein